MSPPLALLYQRDPSQSHPLRGCVDVPHASARYEPVALPCGRLRWYFETAAGETNA